MKKYIGTKQIEAEPFHLGKTVDEPTIFIYNNILGGAGNSPLYRLFKMNQF